MSFKAQALTTLKRKERYSNIPTDVTALVYAFRRKRHSPLRRIVPFAAAAEPVQRRRPQRFRATYTYTLFTIHTNTQYCSQSQYTVFIDCDLLCCAPLSVRRRVPCPLSYSHRASRTTGDDCSREPQEVAPRPFVVCSWVPQSPSGINSWRCYHGTAPEQHERAATS